MKIYMHNDTGVFWKEDEIKLNYDVLVDPTENYETFDDYVDYEVRTGCLVEVVAADYTVYGREITWEDVDVIATYMDDDLREAIHNDLTPCEPQEFLAAYLMRDPNLREVLENEFCFKEGKHD